MIVPADLLVALVPTLLVACLWLKDVVARRLREAHGRMTALWHERASERRIGRPV